jgi:HEPN domain-containing protein
MPGHKGWLLKANGDLAVARTGLTSPEPGALDTASFLCHQCAEKSLKAFLAFLHHEISKTHDLDRLLKICIEFEPLFQQLKTECSDLNFYALKARYPDDQFSIDQAEVTVALEKAAKVLTLTKKIIAERQHPNTRLF